jgi:HEAT repeat protein
VTTRLALAIGLCAALAPVGAQAAARPARGTAAPAQDPAVVDLLVELLAAGTSPDRATAALGALAKIADPRGFEALELYAVHRRPELRREAVKALAALADPRVVPPLLDRLGDESPEVRAAAASALAERHEASAVPRLMRLCRRGDIGAAAPLGRLATPDTLGELREQQGAIKEDVLATALGASLRRSDIGDGARIDNLRAIGKLHGALATAAIADYLASIPAQDNRASRKEAQRLLDERGGDR